MEETGQRVERRKRKEQRRKREERKTKGAANGRLGWGSVEGGMLQGEVRLMMLEERRWEESGN